MPLQNQRPKTKDQRPSQIKLYFALTKPGVLFGNAITAGAGFLLAAHGQLNIGLFLALFIGTTLVIASACVINNVLDKDIDRVMTRTKTRPTAAGLVPDRNAFILSTVLGIVGFAILGAWTNLLVIASGIIGWIVYVWAYGVQSKRKSVHGTLVGAISGAMPIVAGYLAVTNRLDLGAALLFIILFAWQMPEFYSIAIYRLQEYKAAGVPVITVVKGVDRTKKEILFYTAIFVVASVLLSIFRYAGLTYMIVMAVFGVYWLYIAVQGQYVKDAEGWARRMFKFSLVMILLLCVMLSVGSVLP